jgi:hypothetical protein
VFSGASVVELQMLPTGCSSRQVEGGELESARVGDQLWAAPDIEMARRWSKIWTPA